ncbi:DUF1129 domain-containing protein [Facklamia miroungae]|uniref:Uncharacterized membrane-anchored protein n=1 Tax=Facklamia miroungae TaxID=120956 RepID=A0A1G7SYU8_9LACT|nr:DUF1129 family protein [Facklamia miroungae]NKZ29479.1 DUF1129 family protein [Facklamia miroungae]SDG28237.1 Uncharacterized membrane-anchored protein [Facklamia miroungae]
MKDKQEEKILTKVQEVEREEHQDSLPSEESSILTGVPQEKVDQLTKRNLKFLLDIDRQLRASHVSQSNCQAVYLEMVDTLLEGQKDGHTAKHIYGTPSETSQIIINKAVKEEENLEKSPDWQIAVDGGLMLGAIFTLITGIFGLTGSSSVQDNFYMGIITVILNYAIGGYAMMKTAKVLPNLDAPKGQKGYGRYFMVSTVAMMAWIGLIMLSQAFIPPVINPILPPIGYIILGVITLALRYYLKNKWKIVGGLF